MFLKKFCCCLDLVRVAGIWSAIQTMLGISNINKLFPPTMPTIKVDPTVVYVLFATEIISSILLIYGAIKV